MKSSAGMPGELERLLARLLLYGTFAACAIIAFGLVLVGSGVDSGAPVATGGIALLILLPIIRLLVMLIVFLRSGDYRYGAVSGLVILIILASFLLGRR